MQIAVILAAGEGRRIKPLNKIFYRIFAKPLILYTILAFEKHPQIQKIILVAKRTDFKKILRLIKKYDLKKIEIIVEGGKARQDSAFKGLRAAENLGAKKEDIILFHNGANPSVSPKEITKIIKVVKKYKAALIGHLARDTIKQIDNNSLVVKTLDRKKIFLAQTPQVIEYTLAKKAFEKAYRDKFFGTDDVSLVERLGKRVKIVPGSFKNIKVTFPEDLIFVKPFLKK